MRTGGVITVPGCSPHLHLAGEAVFSDPESPFRSRSLDFSTDLVLGFFFPTQESVDREISEPAEEEGGQADPELQTKLGR